MKLNKLAEIDLEDLEVTYTTLRFLGNCGDVPMGGANYLFEAAKIVAMMIIDRKEHCG
jgi:hypothetical protein